MAEVCACASQAWKEGVGDGYETLIVTVELSLFGSGDYAIVPRLEV